MQKRCHLLVEIAPARITMNAKADGGLLARHGERLTAEQLFARSALTMR